MKKYFNYDVSFEVHNGCMPPTNTPSDKQPIIKFDTNYHVLWPTDQKFYTSKELKNYVQQDFHNHPLVQHLKPLIHRKPIQLIMRRYEDPLLLEKKREILNNIQWLSIIKESSNEFAKTLKFRINQLSQSNYNQISDCIVDLLKNNHQHDYLTFIEQITDIAANQNKFRHLYSRLLKDIIQQTNSYKYLEQYLNNFIFNDQLQELHNPTLEEYTKRKLNFIGKYKFIVQLYKDYIIKIHFINNSIIQLVNHLMKQQNQQQEEIVEAILEIIGTMKNDLFLKQYKSDIQMEQQFLQFKAQWNKEDFCFSQKGIKQLLKWIEKQVQSQRLKILILNLNEKLDNQWRNKKNNKQQKKNDVVSETSESEIEELKQKSSIKLDIQNIDKITEAENDFSVSKQPTIKQILQFLEKIFLIKVQEDFQQEIIKLYKQLKTSELIISFWSCYLRLSSRITQDNCWRIACSFTIFIETQEEFIQELIIEQIQIKLSDIIYDIIESKFGQIYISNFLKPFIQYNIKLLELLPIYEDALDFLMIIIPKLVSNIQTIERLEYLQQFLITKLKLNEIQYRTVMDSI